MNEFNKVQNAAFELIRADARFLITITDIYLNANIIDSNYMSMTIPYIGIFADGAEQWGRKVGFQSIKFSDEEKEYYCLIRNGHKLYEKSYNELKNCLINKLKESDEHFYSIRSFLEKIIGYYNFGADKIKGEYCGNTILCAAYTPYSPFSSASGPQIMKLSEVAGALAAFYSGSDYKPYQYSHVIRVTYENFHFTNNSPIKVKNFDGFILFSMLCNINYAVVFIENFFTEEVVQKFKYAYLQYFYLCEFVQEFNNNTCFQLRLNNSLYHRKFRNCLAHYGLGQFMHENDIDEDDLLKGLTMKAFNLSYLETKKRVYGYLVDLANQIKEIIFN